MLIHYRPSTRVHVALCAVVRFFSTAWDASVNNPALAMYRPKDHIINVCQLTQRWFNADEFKICFKYYNSLLYVNAITYPASDLARFISYKRVLLLFVTIVCMLQK